MDPDMMNYVFLRFHLEKIYKILAMPSSGELELVQGMGVKKSPKCDA